MLKTMVAGIVGVGLLAGCNMTHLQGPPAAMSIKGSEAVMIGQYDFPSVRPGTFGRVEVTAELNVSNGELTCSGAASYPENPLLKSSCPLVAQMAPRVLLV